MLTLSKFMSLYIHEHGLTSFEVLSLRVEIIVRGLLKWLHCDFFDLLEAFESEEDAIAVFHGCRHGYKYSS